MSHQTEAERRKEDASFEEDLAIVINRHSMENGIPDFILAEMAHEFIVNVQAAYEATNRWRGIEPFNPTPEPEGWSKKEGWG